MGRNLPESVRGTSTDWNLILIVNEAGLEVCRFSQPVMVESLSLGQASVVISIKRRTIKEVVTVSPEEVKPSST